MTNRSQSQPRRRLSFFLLATSTNGMTFIRNYSADGFMKTSHVPEYSDGTEHVEQFQTTNMKYLLLIHGH